MRRLLHSLIAVVLTCNGCASLSLFGSTHHHTHQHGEDGNAARLSALEARMQALEQSLVVPTPIPTETAPPPVLMAPPIEDGAAAGI